MTISLNYLRHKNFAIYGLGVTGLSVIDYFDKYGFKNYIGWDDNNKTLKRFLGSKYTRMKRDFLKLINYADYIIVSPGVNIYKAKLKKILLKNKQKIITDIDLFYLFNPNLKSIVVTGTNGKSTTCKIIEHVLKKNNIKTSLGGNIGRPILDLIPKENSLVIIEASSFQLEYSKFISPNYAMILNITKDHLDWHKTFKNYTESKFKIFLNQKKNDFAFLNNKKFTDVYKRKNFKGKLKFVSIKKYKSIREKIKNIYLKSKVNDENMSFAYHLLKKFNISNASFIKSVNSFKGLQHRHEVFFKKKNMIFINDSKATSFEATKQALLSNKNIYWIVGGLPKKNDYFYLRNLKKQIIKAYIIGKNSSFFKKQIQKYIPYTISRNMKNAVNNIHKDIRVNRNLEKTILLSPAAASFDQFKNFENRGFFFKNLIMKKFK